MEKTLNVGQVANILSLHKYTVYEKAKRGEIPAIRIGRTWHFPATVFNRWLNENSKTENDLINKSADKNLQENIRILLLLSGIFAGPKDLAKNHNKYLYKNKK